MTTIGVAVLGCGKKTLDRRGVDIVRVYAASVRRLWENMLDRQDFALVCCLHIQNRSGLPSVPSNVRTHLITDGGRFLWSQATYGVYKTRKGYGVTLDNYNYQMRVHLRRIRQKETDPERSTQKGME